MTTPDAGNEWFTFKLMIRYLIMGFGAGLVALVYMLWKGVPCA